MRLVLIIAIFFINILDTMTQFFEFMIILVAGFYMS